jgi:flavin reductase (DIM6/NTAB) family NADH-FMN oxidoreductase RutF
MKKSVGNKTWLYPAPALVVATYDDAGQPNAMTAAWGGICCSKPPAVAVSLREATYSYGNIVSRAAFTVNVPSVEHAAAVDYFGMASGRDQDKFGKTGLTPVRSSLVDAPMVDEFPLVLECRLLHTLKIGLHTQFVGEILDVKIDEAVLDAAGLPDMPALQPIIYAPGSRQYFGIGPFLGRAYSLGRG